MGSVLVAGSINMDIVVTAPRRPAIGETVQGTELFFLPGGKGANQAVAAARLGAPTALIGRLGADAFGAELRAFLGAGGINLDHVSQTGEAPTGAAVITVAGGDNTIVVIRGANGLLGPADIAIPPIRRGDILVSQFEIPLPAVSAFFARGRASGARTILNPSPVVPFDRDLLQLVDVLVLNEIELGLLTARPLDIHTPDADMTAAMRGLQATPGQTICVTLGGRGALVLEGSEVIAIPGRRVSVIDTTGAGDCFVGALAAQLATGASIGDATRYANRAASLSVQKMGAGASMPTTSEVVAAGA